MVEKARRPKKTIQATIDELTLKLENVLTLAQQQGYLIEMRTVERVENTKRMGRLTLVSPNDSFVPTVSYQLYLPVAPSENPPQLFADNKRDENDNGTTKPPTE